MSDTHLQHGSNDMQDLTIKTPAGTATLAASDFAHTGSFESNGKTVQVYTYQPEPDHSTAEWTLQQWEQATRERMLADLHSELATLVEAGELTDEQANEWYNAKADQWAASPY